MYLARKEESPLKKRSIILGLLLAFVLSLGMSAAAASPHWASADQCKATLSFSGKAAQCDLYIKAKERTAKINATLYHVGINGGLTQVSSWSGLSGTGSLSVSKSWSSCTSGQNYRNKTVATVYSGSQSESVTAYSAEKVG